MSRRPLDPVAAGAPLALSITGGAVIGAALNQPSAGFVIGLGVGVAIAVALWIVDRRRIGR